jgi:hypothetical protein
MTDTPPGAPDGARLREIEARLDRLEAPPPKFLGVFRDWQEALKVIGLPLAMVYGGLTFYDEVWTRWDREAEIRAAAGQESLRELQGMNERLYRWTAEGQEDAARSFAEAQRGRRARLIVESLALWEERPDYFLPSEAQMLANELLLDGRTDIAMRIARTLTAEDPVDAVDLALFKGRIAGAEGPANDVEAMRGHMREALGVADALPSERQRITLTHKIAVAWIYAELLNETGCERAEPLAFILEEYTLPEGEPGRGPLDDMAEGQLGLYAGRCGG